MREAQITYRVIGLDPAPFRELFGLPDDELARRGVVRMTVNSPTFPCRVSLTDRAIGDSVLLLNHVSHDVANPYRASHAIFVSESAAEAAVYEDEIPPALERRILSLRAFDHRGMMVDARLAQPGEGDEVVRDMLANAAVEHIDAHNAIRGCFAARVERA